MIKKTGLKPYRLGCMNSKDIIDKTNKRKGIWLWSKDLKGKTHLGTIIYQVSSKNSDKIVKLKVWYDTNQLLKGLRGERVWTSHYGQIDKYIYHTKEEGVIIIEPIPPSEIELVKVYDLIKLVSD